MSFLSQAFKCEKGFLKNTDGSALLSEGNTSVLAGVYGPGDIRESKQNFHRAVVEVNFRPKIGMPALNEKYHERFVRSVLESAINLENYPKSCFYVTTQIMESRGSLLACSTNSAVLALVDAGVMMSFIPVSVCVAVCEKEDLEGKKCIHVVPNPDAEDEACSLAQMTFTFNSASDDLVSCRHQGKLSQQRYEECLKLAKLASHDKLKEIRHVLQNCNQ